MPKDKSISNSSKPIILLATSFCAAIAIFGFWQVSQLSKQQESASTAALPASTPTSAAPKAVTALGRLSPKGEVIKKKAIACAKDK